MDLSKDSPFPALNMKCYPKTPDEYNLKTPCSLYFDMLLDCASLKGRFRNYYRHGSFSNGRNCGEYSDELLFCFRQHIRTRDNQKISLEQRIKEKQQSSEFVEHVEKIWSWKNIDHASDFK